MSIGDHLLQHAINYQQSALKEALCRRHVPCGTEPKITRLPS